MTEEIRKKIEEKSLSIYKGHDDMDYNFYTAFVNGGAYGYSLSEQQIADLKEWKRQAMEVMPDMQEIGKLLNVPLGQSIHDKIVPGIADLKAEVERLKELLKGQLYSIWKGCDSELPFEDWKHKFITGHNL